MGVIAKAIQIDLIVLQGVFLVRSRRRELMIIPLVVSTEYSHEVHTLFNDIINLIIIELCDILPASQPFAGGSVDSGE